MRCALLMGLLAGCGQPEKSPTPETGRHVQPHETGEVDSSGETGLVDTSGETGRVDTSGETGLVDTSVEAGVVDTSDETGCDDLLDGTLWYADVDDDGYGDALVTIRACNAPDGYVGNDDDCDDTDAAISPDAVEICDELDNDCDGEVDGPDAADASIWYADADGDGYGDASVTISACDAPDGYLDDATDCADDDATTWPGAAEVCGDGVVNDCAGDAAEVWETCAAGTRSLSDAELVLEGEVRGDHAGGAVSAAGDVDGDGLADLLIGAYGDDTAGTDAGAAYLVLGVTAAGSSALDLARADLKLTGESSGANAGVTVSGAGDVDGDGLADLLVGAPGDAAGGSAAGAAWLVRGTTAAGASALALSDADLKLVGEVAYDNASPVGRAGDVDGDGLDDLLVGAPQNDSGGSNAGAAYLVLGAEAGSGTLDLSDASLKLVGEASGDSAGRSVAGAGDVDGDGLADLLIGAYGDDVGGAEAGAAVLVLAASASSDTLDLSDADAKLVGEAAGDAAGRSVAGAGDVDGDGLADLLIGAYLQDAGGTNAGAAYLVLATACLGTLDLSDANLKLVGEVASDDAGFSAAGAGDVDGDGLADLLVGAYLQDAGGTNAGAAYLVQGASAEDASTLDLSDASLKLLGVSVYDDAGTSVAGVGDADGDGLDDLLIGALGYEPAGSAGSAWLVLGGGY